MTIALLNLIAGNPARQEVSPVLYVEVDVVGVRDRAKRGGLELVLGMTGDPA